MMRSSNERDLQLPSGFRFHPTDEELVMDYLCRKCASQRIAAPVIAEVDLYKFDPWQLPDLAIYGEKEWYFFSPRDRKYPNGSRPNRSAGNGYWKATGADKPIGRLTTVAIKKALVFYAGKHTKGIKTNWIMHEYRLANVDRSAKGHLRLDDWVLCRIYNKRGIMEKYEVDEKPIMPPPMPHHQLAAGGLGNDFVSFDLADESMPTLHTEESSGGSECVTASPGLSYNNKEVQSEAKPIWADLDLDTNFMDGIPLDDDESMFQFQMEQFSP